MELYEYIVIAIVMAMDAFAVSICKGVTSKEQYAKTGLVCGTWFGGFQALMPLLGWLFGILLMKMTWFESVSGYVASALLFFLGGKMVFESLNSEEECCCCEKENSLGVKTMFVFAIATSIDALAVGVSISCLSANIWLAISLIGIVTFALSFVGSVIGAKIGSKYEQKAEFVGGLVLIGLAIKFLLDVFF